MHRIAHYTGMKYASNMYHPCMFQPAKDGLTGGGAHPKLLTPLTPYTPSFLLFERSAIVPFVYIYMFYLQYSQITL